MTVAVRQSGEETNFTDEFTLGNLGDRASRLSFVYRKATGQHDEKAARWLAFANQKLTASQDSMVGFGSQGLERQQRRPIEHQCRRQ